MYYLESGKVIATAKAAKTQDLLVNFDFVSDELTDGEKIIAKKIVVKVPNYGKIPEGRQGAGNKAWTFIDEIVVQ